MERIPVIKTSDLSIGYILKGGQKKCVHDALDLNLYPGEVTCLLGLNGAGKSTLLRTLCGFQPPLGGEIELMGKPLNSYSQGNFSRLVGVVLTEKTNAGGITVYELVSLGRHPYTGFFGQLRQEDRRIIEESLAAASIAHKAYKAQHSFALHHGAWNHRPPWAGKGHKGGRKCCHAQSFPRFGEKKICSLRQQNLHGRGVGSMPFLP